MLLNLTTGEVWFGLALDKPTEVTLGSKSGPSIPIPTYARKTENNTTTTAGPPRPHHLAGDAVEELSPPHVFHRHVVHFGVVLEELVDVYHVGVLDVLQDGHLDGV